MQQRLQKIIAAAGYCSRRKAEELITAGRVTVDGRVAVIGEQADAETNDIRIDGKPLKKPEPFYYILLNKPVGTVTTLKDPEGRPLVTDLLKDIPVRVFPVGRLDINTSGLLLLTNDGALAHRLAHPSHEVDKVYLVRVRGHLSASAQKTLQEGVKLEDVQTAPAKIDNVRIQGNHSWFEMTIHEGRNRQVRRMCEAVDFPVSRLARIGYAFLSIGQLGVGRYRQLTEREVARLKAL
jgi:23S rRNA pseudouridine2605 synthase